MWKVVNVIGSRLWFRDLIQCVVVGLIVCLASGSNATAQSDPDPDVQTNGSSSANVDGPLEATAEPLTTGDPEIPIAHLEFLVKPLTAEELQVEAAAWRDLVKAKGWEIAQVRIAGQQQNAAVSTPQENSDQTVETQGTTGSANLPQADAEDTEDAVAQQDDEQQGNSSTDLAEALTTLTEERSELIDRLRVVVDAWEKKGGDGASYYQYISAVSGLDVPMSDAKATWTVIQGWLKSEQGGIRWAWNLVKFLVILIAFYFGASIAASLARHGATRFGGSSQLLVDFLGRFVKQVVLAVGFVVALAALEVNIAPLLAAIGAAGFVVAFALQDTLSNFASGLLILTYRPFDVGDAIDAAGVSGVVDSVSLFSTHIRTFDNKLMIVPNNDIWRGTITNATAKTTRRVDMTFGIGYGDDIETAHKVLVRLVDEHPLILDDPAPTIQLNELGESSVNLICRPWTKREDYWTVYWDMMRRVKEEFDRVGISIPFPQRDIHVFHESTVKSDGQDSKDRPIGKPRE